MTQTILSSLTAVDDPNEGGLQEYRLQRPGSVEMLQFRARVLIDAPMSGEAWRLYHTQSDKFVFIRWLPPGSSPGSSPNQPYQVFIIPGRTTDMLAAFENFAQEAVFEKNRKTFWCVVLEFVKQHPDLRAAFIEVIPSELNARVAAQLGTPATVLTRRPGGKFVQWTGWLLLGGSVWSDIIPSDSLYLLADGRTYLHWRPSDLSTGPLEPHFYTVDTVRPVVLGFLPDAVAAAAARWPELDQTRVTEI